MNTQELLQLLTPIMAAIFYGVTGYLKQKPLDAEKFDGQKFAGTMLIGCIIGLIMFMVKTSFDIASALVLSTGLVVIIENLLKIMWRRFGGIPAKKNIRFCPYCRSPNIVGLTHSVSGHSYLCANCGRFF